MLKAQDVTTPVPTDADAPRMYLHTVYLLGGTIAFCIGGIVALLLAAPAVADVGVPVLGTLAGAAVSALAGLLTPRRTA